MKYNKKLTLLVSFRYFHVHLIRRYWQIHVDATTLAINGCRSIQICYHHDAFSIRCLLCANILRKALGKEVRYVHLTWNKTWRLLLTFHVHDGIYLRTEAQLLLFFEHTILNVNTKQESISRLQREKETF